MWVSDILVWWEKVYGIRCRFSDWNILSNYLEGIECSSFRRIKDWCHGNHVHSSESGWNTSNSLCYLLLIPRLRKGYLQFLLHEIVIQWQPLPPPPPKHTHQKSFRPQFYLKELYCALWLFKLVLISEMTMNVKVLFIFHN